MRYLSITLLFFCLMAFTSSRPAYLLYDRDGQPTDYETMIRILQEADIVLFGEQHNNPICHWLQLETTTDLHKQKQQDLVLAAEMFEADNQLILSEYLQGLMREANFKKEAKIWNNYDTDYAPLVNFAKTNKLAFVASNVPRRYASLVARNGLPALDELPKEAKQYIAPLPIKVDMELPGYKNMIAMMGGSHGMDPAMIVHAQAIKDATMAHFIAENWRKGKQIIHYNGAYHSNNFEGIVWYLKQYAPKLKVATISSVEQADIQALAPESKGLADFVICIPSNMTKTYTD